ncbi:MAG TPA: VIT domain-containing protein [Planctomycetota bacterium]|nr:VIT domain-containing protein [Planctomycetota bacterium]
MLHRLSLLALIVLFAASVVRAEGLFVPIVNQQAVPSTNFVIPPDVNRPNRRPLPPAPSRLPFRITSCKVDVRIEENVATTSIEQSVLNLSGQNLEVKMMYPLPAGAVINNSSLSMDGQMIEGQLHNAEEAQRIYQSIVMQRRDPMLLRYAGENLYEASIFPVPPNQERKLKFSYTQMLSATAGLYDFRHIMTTSQHYDEGIGHYEFNCQIRSKGGLGPVYSASHQVDIQRPDANTAIVKLAGNNLSSENDLRLYYSPAKGDVAFRVITHRVSEAEDGYFMLIGRADESLNNAKLPAKELVFVVDRSGSMQGPKIQQTKNALKFCLNSLNERDRFNLITFSTDVEGLSSGPMMPATKANIDKALAAVDQIEASGGTNIDGALRAAIGSDFTDGPATAKMIVFMTDGLPTNGVTDMGEILRGMKDLNKKKVRFFNFGVGDDVNTHLLDQLANDQEGTCTYVSPREDIEIKVSDFFAKVKNPVMTDAFFDFGSGSGANSIYPKKISALFKGAEFVLTGRYKGSGPGEIVLTGSVYGEQKRIAIPIEWPARSLDNSFLPRVWAMRKIGHLLESMRLNGQNPEIVKEIVDLATRHGIVTPYTSQLVLEPGMNMPNTPRTANRGGRGELDFAEGRDGVSQGTSGFGFRDAQKADKPEDALREQVRVVIEARKDAERLADRARQLQTGENATALADLEKDLKQAADPKTPLAPAAKPADLAAAADAKKVEARTKWAAAERTKAGGFGGGGGNGAYRSFDANAAKLVEEAQEALIKHVGERTFYNRGGVWIDSQVKADAKPTIIKQFSPEYFDLLKKEANLGEVLALGGKIMVQSGTTVYQIED